jgi:hypothetical protein
MQSQLPLVISRAGRNEFSELFVNRFWVDDTVEDALVQLCQSEYATPAIIRKFVRHYPALPVTEISLYALCRRQYTGLDAETRGPLEAEEIACHLLTHGSCRLDNRLIEAAESRNSSLRLKGVFLKCLDRIEHAWRVTRDSKNARLFKKSFARRKSEKAAHSETRFDLGKGQPLSMGSEEDVQSCVLLKKIISKLLRVCFFRSH